MKTMTRFFSLAALLLAAAGFSACSSDSNTVIDQPEVTPAPKTYSVSIDAAKGDDGSISRALSLDGDNLTSAWAEGEEVTVYNITQSAELGGTLTAQAAGANTTLAGTLTGNIAAGDELLLKFCSDSYNNQNGTLAYISANCDYATATVKVDKVTDSAFFVADAANFVNHQAIIKFTLMDKGNSDALINPSAFTISDGTTTVTLSNIPASTYETNGGDGVLFVAFPAAGEPKTITLTATVGSDTYTYERADVTFTNADFWTIPVKMSVYIPDANGYESVDLGIVVNGKKILFCTKNVGADSETDWGDYFAWGATEPWYSSKDPTVIWKEGKTAGYVQANAPYYENGSYIKYTKANDVLEPSDDAAHVNMGSDWYMPTHEEWVALNNNCTNVLTTVNGVRGRRFTSKVYTSKSIFLPAAGYAGYWGTGFSSRGSECEYWSATVSSYTDRVWSVLSTSSSFNPDRNDYRYYGFPVRGVMRQ